MSTVSTTTGTTVTTKLTRTPGRFLSRARDQFLVTDSTTGRGGTEEAWTAGELLLSALGTCTVSSVTYYAREENAPLADVTADVSYTRDPDDQTRYASVTLQVTTEGVTQDVAERLVRLYTENCPVFGTVTRGSASSGGISVQVRADQPADVVNA
ncbi:MAG TPA: OsmC family protein [Trebonia sp.]|jgi:uncharacterized OsmC-like protein